MAYGTSFNWNLFLLLVALAVPGVLVSIPRLVEQLGEMGAGRLPEGKTLPPRRVLLVVASIQYLILAAIPAAVGVALSPRVGPVAPVFTATANGDFVEAAVVTAQVLLPTLLVGGAGALVFLAAYYGFFRPRLDAETRRNTEQLRMGLGLASRLLYGGVVEEIIARWGLMTALVWLGVQLVGRPATGVMWAAIVLAGIVFGLLHLPTYLAGGARPTPIFVAYMIALNLWASLIFGWLFWQYGLLAAMLAHMLFHLLWLPFDRRYAEPVAGGGWTVVSG